MKYFLLGSFSSAFFLFGIAMAYGASGSTRLPAVAIPNRKKAEENEPSRKYFIAPSIEPSLVEKPVSTYRDSDRISSARNAMIRSAETANNVIPAVANSSNGENSALPSPERSK